MNSTFDSDQEWDLLETEARAILGIGICLPPEVQGHFSRELSPAERELLVQFSKENTADIRNQAVELLRENRKAMEFFAALLKGGES